MKKTQNGSSLIILLVMLGFIVVTVGLVIIYSIGVRDNFVRLENSITSNYEDSKNVHSNYVLKIQEMAQVPKMATEQLQVLIRESIQGRYGEDGSKAVFQFIKEQNPTVAPELYTNIQKEIAGGRSDFENKIRIVIDNKRVAYNMLDQSVSGMALSFMGMPRKNIGYNGQKDDYPVIMSNQSKTTFETGIDEGVKF